MREKQLHRLIRLVGLLQSGRSFTAEELAAELGASRRTVFRDLKVLYISGLPQAFDPSTNHYRICNEHSLFPVSFTLPEALSLLLLTQKLPVSEMLPEFESAYRAGLKIESLLSEGVREECGSLLDNMAFRWPPVSDAAGLGDVWRKIGQALSERRKIRCRYDSYYEGAEIETVLWPYRLVFISRGWYVVAYSELHGEPRTFKLERIVGLQAADGTFAMPEGFSLDEYFGNAWQMIRGDKRHTVVIRFKPKVASNVNEVWWHRTQRTEWLDDGSLLFMADVDGIEEISWWVMGYGDQAVVESPPELQDLLRRRARGMVAMYADGTGKE